MKTKTYYTNYRIVVTPKDMTQFGGISMSRNLLYKGDDAEKHYLKDMQKRVEEMMQEIKRHVDYVDTARFEYDTDECCIYCGRSDWILNADGCPDCCSEAQRDWFKEQGMTEEEFSVYCSEHDEL